MNRAIKAGQGYVEIGIKNRIQAGARGVQSDLDKLGKSLRNRGSSFARAGALIGAAAAGPLAVIVRSASAMEETMGKFGVVFGDQASAVEDWSDRTAAAMGTSEESMASMLSGMQDLLVPMGVADSKATEMSKTMSMLAVDLGSFNNMDTAWVFRDMQAAMTGSGEVMKKYGVILTEAATKQELINMQLDPKTADNAAKAQARLNIIMRGTTAAQGDAIRTSGSFANQTKRLWSMTKDLTAAMGAPLLKPLSGFLQIINSSATGIKAFVKENQPLVRILGLALLAVGGLGAATISLGLTMSFLGFAFSGLATAIGLLMNPITLVVAGIAGLGVAFVKYTQMGADAMNFMIRRFGEVVQAVTDGMAAILVAVNNGDISKAWQLTTDLMELLWLDLTGGMRNAWAELMGWVLDAGSMIAAGIGAVFQGLAGILGTMLDAYRSYYDSVFKWAEKKANAIGAKLSGVRTIGAPVERTNSAFAEQFGGVDDALQKTIDGVKKFGENMEDAAMGQVDQRKQERDEARKAREARVAELRAGLKVEGKAAKERIAEYFSGGDGGGGGPAGGGDVRAGTFSAFAGVILGSGKSTGQRLVTLNERIARATERMAIHGQRFVPRDIRGLNPIQQRAVAMAPDREKALAEIAENTKAMAKAARMGNIARFE